MASLQKALTGALEDTPLGDFVERSRQKKLENDAKQWLATQKAKARERNFEKALELAQTRRYRNKSISEIWEIVQNDYNSE